MGAVTSLEHRSIAVQPGGEAVCSVLVRNTGTVVDQFTIEVLGAAQTWARVEPAVVNLLPDAEDAVSIVFRPPRSSDVAAGIVPFGVRISSREDPAGSVVEEGSLDVGELTDIKVELIPRRARGRRQAKCDVAIDNLGNHPVNLQVEPVDPDQFLRFSPERTELLLNAGTTVFIGLVMRPDQTFLRGPEQTRPFQVRLSGPGVPPTVAEGAMLQQPLLPKWLPAALAALLALLLGLVALWFFVFKGVIQSAAQEAAAEEVQEVASAANEAQAQAARALEAAGGGAGAGADAGAGAGAGAPGEDGDPAAPDGNGPSTPGAASTREPIDFRIAADAPRTDGDSFQNFGSGLPTDQTLVVSDVVLQNPFGDSGVLRVLRVVDGQQSVLLEVGLGNFRDLDYHFVQPWWFNPGQEIVLAVNCQNPPDRERCRPSASFSGYIPR